MPAVAEHAVVYPVGRKRADGDHRDIVNKEHYHRKYRETEPTVGNNLVYFIGSGEISHPLFLIAALDYRGYVDISLVCDYALRIVVHLSLCSLDVVLYMRELFGGDIKLCENLLVTLENLYRIPSLLLCGEVMERSLLNMSYRMLNTAREAVLRDGLCSRRCGYCRLCRLRYSGPLKSGYLSDLTAELMRELLCIDVVTVLLYDVHHVDGDDNRYTELGQLCRKIKVTLKVRAVDDIEYRIRTLIHEVISRHNLLKGVGRKRVDTRKVGDYNIAVPFQLALFFLNGDTRPVTYELVRACQRVEQGCLTGIRVTGKSNSDSFVFHNKSFPL